MSSTVLYMSMSLDGFIAGPNERPENGLGDGGERAPARAAGDTRVDRIGSGATLFAPGTGRWGGGAGRGTPSVPGPLGYHRGRRDRAARKLTLGGRWC
jgi:hypothetical protein